MPDSIKLVLVLPILTVKPRPSCYPLPTPMLNFNLLFLTASLALAVTTTPTPIAKPTSIVENFRKTIQDKVQEKINEVKASGTKKALLGTVKTSNLLDLEIETPDGQTKKITLSDDIVYTDGKQKLQLATLKPGQVVLLLGYIKSDDSFDAKRIVLQSKDDLEKPRLSLVVGHIADISKTTKTLLIVPGSNIGKEIQATVDDKTVFLNTSKKSISYTDLKKSQKIIAFTRPKDKTGKTQIISKLVLLSDLTPAPSPTPTVAKPTKTQ